MIYLATPYTHPDPLVREERYLRAMKVMHGFLAREEWVYCPIVHCHELAKIFTLPVEHEYWLKYNFHMLERCDKLVLVRMDGWETSRGMAAERTWAMIHNKPFEYL